MEASSIITKLKKTPFKYTEASKFRDSIKKMDEEDRHHIISQIRAERGRRENAEIAKALDQVLVNL